MFEIVDFQDIIQHFIRSTVVLTFVESEIIQSRMNVFLFAIINRVGKRRPACHDGKQANRGKKEREEGIESSGLVAVKIK